MSSFEFERRKITAQALREEIFHEILCYYPDLLDQYNEEMKDSESPCGISGTGCSSQASRQTPPRMVKKGPTLID
eukprot:CAMPEP_0179306960 /NCGR_PEP_ID=MMETSP0797-20121207/50399_1 /TAXON_ID=47934 /ORGANISM="Dinophysis acuminata, Strain DAEP01" /LENGTH=74 /DNA_ID=CAMNT_0021016637 /DNA_START=30 /DNA_END=252 /DNA_ORIENTATION=+